MNPWLQGAHLRHVAIATCTHGVRSWNTYCRHSFTIRNVSRQSELTERMPRLLVLYGSQTGNAQDVAERVAREGRHRHFDAHSLPMDLVPLADLQAQEFVIFVCSTTGALCGLHGHQPSDQSFCRWYLVPSSEARACVHTSSMPTRCISSAAVSASATGSVALRAPPLVAGQTWRPRVRVRRSRTAAWAPTYSIYWSCACIGTTLPPEPLGTPVSASGPRSQPCAE